VGTVLVQLAVARGARVLGTASLVNHRFLAGLGARPLTYGPGLPARVPERVDAAIDVAGRGGPAELVTLIPAVVTLVDPAHARVAAGHTRGKVVLTVG
jgi:hypothetical protein